MEFRALGPLELWAHGRQYKLGTPKERCVLAVLLCSPGTPLTAETLIGRVWDDEPPRAAVQTLQTYLSRLRRRLESTGEGGAHLRWSSGTYRLLIDRDTVDLHRFRRLAGQARAAEQRGERERAVELLLAAEGLWREEPFAELSGTWVESVRERLREDLHAVRRQRTRLEMDLGRAADVVGDLWEWLGARPVAEWVVKNLMVALHRCDRNGDALLVYDRARRRLREELGVDPSPDLRALHQRVLERDPSLSLPVPAAAPARSVGTGPRPATTPRTPGPVAPPAAPPGRDTLLRDIPDFTGRADELRLLLSPDDGGTALPVAVVHGMGGIGKTALVTHAAHRLAGRYPAGRLHIELHGHSRQQPRDPSEALAVLLSGMGVDGKLPASLDDRAALWRERMAGSSVLLVLDDARDAEQVRPLLPGAPGCRVLITSRHRMADLEGARFIPLDVLTAAEAMTVFTRIAGRARASDPAAVREVVELCGRHPLALQLVATRFRHRDAWEVRDLVDRLEQAPHTLDAIDAPTGIASAFGLSYAELTAEEQRLFRRLSLHPGPGLSCDAAAALAGQAPARVRAGLDALVEANLLEEQIRDRYSTHSLVKAFARRTAEQEDPADERNSAVHRLLTHYLATADRAGRLAHPHRRRLRAPVPDNGVPLPVLRDADEAQAWLDMERPNLLAAAWTAAAVSPDHACLFPGVLAQALDSWGAWSTAARLHEHARRIWEECGDEAAVGAVLVDQASSLWNQGAHAEALACADRALGIARGRGDHGGQAEALVQAGRAHLVAGHRPQALQAFDEALALYRRVGDRWGEAETLRFLGLEFAYAGRFAEAAEQFHESLRICRDIDHRHGAVRALNNIGEIHRIRHEYDTARDYFEQSLALVRRIGGLQESANLYQNLGEVCRAAGEYAEALSYFRRALDRHQAGEDRRCEADVLVSIGLTHHQCGRTDDALDHLRRAAVIAERIADQYTRQNALVAIAAALRASGRCEEGLAAAREALAVSRACDFPYGRARALEEIALLVRATRGAGPARPFWEQALGLYTTLDMAPEAEAVRRHVTESATGTEAAESASEAGRSDEKSATDTA